MVVGVSNFFSSLLFILHCNIAWDLSQTESFKFLNNFNRRDVFLESLSTNNFKTYSFSNIKLFNLCRGSDSLRHLNSYFFFKFIYLTFWFDALAIWCDSHSWVLRFMSFSWISVCHNVNFFFVFSTLLYIYILRQERLCISIDGSVVECSPATRAARVRFPVDAIPFCRRIWFYCFVHNTTNSHNLFWNLTKCLIDIEKLWLFFLHTVRLNGWNLG